MGRTGYRMAVRALQVANPGDITLSHHWTGTPLRIHSFRHKGYWFHGRNRERSTMIALARLLRPGDVAFDVGGHIGYLAVWMATLVGSSGRVVIFEPGPNNLPYLEANVRGFSNCVVVEKALAAREEQRSFLIENLTGQNNSLLTDGSHFHGNQATAAVRVTTSEITVQASTLDAYVASAVAPALVKIDVEGAELEVLDGAEAVLSTTNPVVVVEISRQHAEVGTLLRDYGYVVLTPELGLAPTTTGGPPPASENFVCLHRSAHADLLERLGVDLRR